MNLPDEINILDTSKFEFEISPSFKFGFYGKKQKQSKHKKIISIAKTINQVHGINIINQEVNLNTPADGIYSHIKSQPICVKTADCLPILCHHPKFGAAALHAGWRGLSGGIIKSFQQLLQEINPNITKDTNFILGPCIGLNKFEVGLEVIEAFKINWQKNELNSCMIINKNNKPQLDMQKLAILQALRLGFKADNIYQYQSCTYENKDLWNSFRRDQPHTEHNYNWISLQ